MVLRRNWYGEGGQAVSIQLRKPLFVSRGEKMKRCHLCGRVRDDAEFVAAHCVWCDELMMDALEWM